MSRKSLCWESTQAFKGGQRDLSKRKNIKSASKQLGKCQMYLFLFKSTKQESKHWLCCSPGFFPSFPFPFSCLLERGSVREWTAAAENGAGPACVCCTESLTFNQFLVTACLPPSFPLQTADAAQRRATSFYFSFLFSKFSLCQVFLCLLTKIIFSLQKYPDTELLNAW